MKEIILSACLIWFVPKTITALVVTILALILGYSLGYRRGRSTYDYLFSKALRKIGGM